MQRLQTVALGCYCLATYLSFPPTFLCFSAGGWSVCASNQQDPQRVCSQREWRISSSSSALQAYTHWWTLKLCGYREWENTKSRVSPLTILFLFYLLKPVIILSLLAFSLGWFAPSIFMCFLTIDHCFSMLHMFFVIFYIFLYYVIIPFKALVVNDIGLVLS